MRTLLRPILAALFLALVAASTPAAQTAPVTVHTDVGTLTVAARTISYETNAYGTTMSRDVLDVAPRRGQYQHAIHDIGMILDYAQLPPLPPLAADADSLEAIIDSLTATTGGLLTLVDEQAAEIDALAAALAETEAGMEEAIAAAVAEATAALQAQLAAETQRADAAEARAAHLDGRITVWSGRLSALLREMRTRLDVGVALK